MSRIGKKEIIIPKSIKVEIKKSTISVDGPKGKLSYKLLRCINIKKIDDKLILSKNYNDKKTQAIHGLSRSIINNMVIGVSEGFEKKLLISGVGYRSQLEGKKLVLNVGYSHPVYIHPPEGISIKVENNVNILIEGINKETVGQIAATIREVRPPEPYKGKGIKYIDEKIKRKIGKAGK
uniref:Large ribosomal subunit protein uL6c n=1 Tax=Dasya naccarioides TaxID=2007180 RepID=A0A1Z1MHK0_9FLOR|nr:ribosomal protein L6 [Dasya naccarioides]ARW65231.1 ribosomal protein L6 [Dasya naccarioides]